MFRRPSGITKPVLYGGGKHPALVLAGIVNIYHFYYRNHLHVINTNQDKTLVWWLINLYELVYIVSLDYGVFFQSLFESYESQILQNIGNIIIYLH